MKQLLVLFATTFLACQVFAQGYIFDKEHKCKVYTTTKEDRRTFTYVNGNCKDGYLNGTATITVLEDEKFFYTAKGNFSHGMLNGDVVYNFVDGASFTGICIDGIKKSGVYNFQSDNGNLNLTKYTGEFNIEGRNGHGKQEYKNGNTFIGDFVNDNPTAGTFYFANGTTEKGKYINGKWTKDESTSLEPNTKLQDLIKEMEKGGFTNSNVPPKNKEENNFKFTSIENAVNYLNTNLIPNQSNYSIEDKEYYVPYPYSYLSITKRDDLNLANLFFSFSEITDVESAYSLDHNLVTVTVPVRRYDNHKKIDEDYVLQFKDKDETKMINAINYLREHVAFGQPTIPNQAVSVNTQQKIYEVYVHNNTNYDIYIAYATDVNGTGNTSTHYWYKFTPGQNSILFRAKSKAFCYYAYSDKGNGKKAYWGGGGYQMVIDGENKDAKCVVIQEGSYKHTLNLNQ